MISPFTLITAFAHNYDMTAWIYRFGNIVGPNPTHGVIHDFVLRLRDDPTRLVVLGDGTQAKPYVYVLYVYDPPGATKDVGGTRFARIERMTANAANTHVAACSARKKARTACSSTAATASCCGFLPSVVFPMTPCSGRGT